MKDLSVSVLCDVYGALLTDKQREITTLYYDDDLSLGEIAERQNVTRQAVHCALQQAEEALRRYEDAVGALRQMSDVSAALGSVKAALAGGDVSAAAQAVADIDDRIRSKYGAFFVLK